MKELKEIGKLFDDLEKCLNETFNKEENND